MSEYSTRLSRLVFVGGAVVAAVVAVMVGALASLPPAERAQTLDMMGSTAALGIGIATAYALGLFMLVRVPMWVEERWSPPEWYFGAYLAALFVGSLLALNLLAFISPVGRDVALLVDTLVAFFAGIIAIALGANWLYNRVLATPGDGVAAQGGDDAR